MTPNGMAREIVLGVATRLYGASDPALEGLEMRLEERIPDSLGAEDATSIACTALLEMLQFPAPGAEDGQDPRWSD